MHVIMLHNMVHERRDSNQLCLPLQCQALNSREARVQCICKAWPLAMAGGLHLSEGEGHAAGWSRQHGALHLVRLAVGYVVLPAVACRASHHQQGPWWQKDGLAFSCLPELHHC